MQSTEGRIIIQGMKGESMENKEAIIKEFVKVLQITQIGQNVIEGEYFRDEREETAILYIRDLFTGKPHTMYVNITGDSGLSILKDIICALEE